MGSRLRAWENIRRVWARIWRFLTNLSTAAWLWSLGLGSIVSSLIGELFQWSLSSKLMLAVGAASCIAAVVLTLRGRQSGPPPSETDSPENKQVEPHNREQSPGPTTKAQRSEARASLVEALRIQLSRGVELRDRVSSWGRPWVQEMHIPAEEPEIEKWEEDVRALLEGEPLEQAEFCRPVPQPSIRAVMAASPLWYRVDHRLRRLQQIILRLRERR